MQYSLTNINGDAGEHLVAARIIKLFKFPCRLIGIDIGIDAEIEIIDNDYKSTGKFVRCQIKTTSSDRFYLYIKEEHIIYWNKMSMPVVVFLVHLETEKIYWHCVDEIEKYEKVESGYKVTFDEGAILVTENKERFKEIANVKLVREISSIYDELYAIVDRDNKEYLNLDEIIYDITTFETFVYNSEFIRYKLTKAQNLLYKHTFLEQVYTDYSNKLKEINQYLLRIDKEKQSILKDSGADYYDYLKSENFRWE